VNFSRLEAANTYAGRKRTNHDSKGDAFHPMTTRWSRTAELLEGPDASVTDKE